MRRYSEAQISAELLPASEKDPEGWGATDKFTVVLVTAGFNATVLGIGLTTLQQWRRQFAGAGDALADRADFGVPGPVHCLRAQLLPGDRHLEPKGGGLGCRKGTFIAADLVSRACLRERISKGRLQPLILHADNGHPGKPAGGAGCAAVLLQTKG